MNTTMTTTNSSSSTAAAASASASASKRALFLTGFGKFDNILENPTTNIVETIQHDANITDALVLEVSAEGAVEMLKPLRKKAEASDKPCVFLHLGVAASAKDFCLEQFGYNLADFRIPDERGFRADGQLIRQDLAKDYASETALPLLQLREKLLAINEKCKISDDPGRYICNLVYFHSLQWVEQQATERADGRKHYALFLHVPPFHVIAFEDQIAFVRELISLLVALP